MLGVPPANKRDRPAPASQRPAYRLFVLACALVLASACSDGYSSKNAVALAPADMTQHQRLEQINAIGRSAYLETRWHYKLVDACELKLTKGRLLSKETQVIQLTQTQLVRRFDRSDKTHDVHLKQTDSVVPLLESANWVDSVRFLTLIDEVRRDCDQTAAA